MKGFLRTILINFFTLFLISKFVGGVEFSESFIILFWAALFLTLLNLLVKPILNMILMPINLLTLGAFRWVVNLIVLLLVTLFVSGFKILPINFAGIAYGGFSIPNFYLTFFWALFLVSFLIEIISGAIYWLIK